MTSIPDKFDADSKIKLFESQHIRSEWDAEALMATSNSPTRGHPKFPQAAQPDYDVSGWMAKRAAASLSL
jgi:hypothetical protein